MHRGARAIVSIAALAALGAAALTVASADPPRPISAETLPHLAGPCHTENPQDVAILDTLAVRGDTVSLIVRDTSALQWRETAHPYYLERHYADRAPACLGKTLETGFAPGQWMPAVALPYGNLEEPATLQVTYLTLGDSTGHLLRPSYRAALLFVDSLFTGTVPPPVVIDPTDTVLTVRIQMAGGGCLATYDSWADGDAWVGVRTCDDSPAQKWTLHADTLKLVATGKCLDVAYARGLEGDSLMAYTCHGELNQRWRVAEGNLVGMNGFCVGGAVGERARLTACPGDSTPPPPVIRPPANAAPFACPTVTAKELPPYVGQPPNITIAAEKANTLTYLTLHHTDGKPYCVGVVARQSAKAWLGSAYDASGGLTTVPRNTKFTPFTERADALRRLWAPFQ